MPRNLILGAGPAAAGVALRLAQETDQEIVVLDLGHRLEPDRRAAVDRLAAAVPQQWRPTDVELVRAQPVAQVRGELPQKRSYGSDYPFRDVGQLDRVSSVAGANASVVSGAYGGFSNVWGAQVMPFSKSTFDHWPVPWEDIEPHYRAVLRHVPLAADRDDLEELFPLLGDAQALPPLAPRTSAVLARYERHRARLRSQGVLVGRARLAFQARDCTTCGLCMTGCPYGLIYSASHTLDRLRAQGAITYHGGLLVERFEQQGSEVVVEVKDVRTSERHVFRGDRAFVACGGLGSTRVTLASLPEPPAELEMQESVQFVVPFLSGRPVADPRAAESSFTLNQFNLLLDFDGDGYTTSQIHCYPYNPSFLEALPPFLRHRAAEPVTREVLKRITVGLGYLPSWASPRIRVEHRRTPGELLPELTVSAASTEHPELLGKVMRRLLRAAPRLDLWPVVTHAKLSKAAKSYHFGGSFPHAAPGTTSDRLTTDRRGRLPAWDRVHLVDGAVLPSVPSTTFTLTVMANAHRIAGEALAPAGQAA